MRLCVECSAPLHGRGRRLYCSEACALVTRTCTTCGDEFQVPRKRKDRNFVCSLKCRPRRAWGRPQIEVSCSGCGEPITTYPSRVEDGRGKYCSRTCAGIHRPINGRPSQIADAAIDLFLKTSPLLCELEKRVGRWSIDLAIPLHMIAVELDGEYWHSLPAMVDRDRRKDAWLTSHGWRVIRIVMAREDTPTSIARRIAKELDSCLISA